MAEKSLPRLLHGSGYYLLATFRKLAPQGPPHELRVVVVDELSAHEQKLWQKRVRYESNSPGESLPHRWLITEFQKYAAQRPSERFRQMLPRVARRRDEIASRFGLRPADLDRQIAYSRWLRICANEKTTPGDIAAHCLWHLWHGEMMLWEEVAPWLAHWRQRYRGHLLAPADLLLEAPKLALPLQANAFRPPVPALEVPDSLSVKEAGERLGITPRQLLYLAEQGRVRLNCSNPHGFRVSLTEMERLENDPHFQHRRKREEYRRKGQARGLTSENLRQRRRRGSRKPDNTPDWEALEANLRRKPTRRRGRTDETPAPIPTARSRDELEDLLAELQRRISTAETEDERLGLMDNRREVERMLEQLECLEPEE
jgi:hypothetical protein